MTQRQWRIWEGDWRYANPQPKKFYETVELYTNTVCLI